MLLPNEVKNGFRMGKEMDSKLFNNFYGKFTPKTFSRNTQPSNCELKTLLPGRTQYVYGVFRNYSDTKKHFPSKQRLLPQHILNCNTQKREMKLTVNGLKLAVMFLNSNTKSCNQSRTVHKPKGP